MKEKWTKIRKVFFSTLYLSAFTFGGGYVIVTLMKKKFVDELHWIDEEEMLDLVAIAQSAPGAIAVNGAIVVGYKLAGIAGALAAIIGTIIPPFVILSVIFYFYAAFSSNYIVKTVLDGMQAGVGAVIASVVYDMGSGIVAGKQKSSLAIMAAAFLAVCIFNVNVVYVVIFCIVLGVVRTLIRKRKEKKMIYWQLFLSFLQIGMFSFGGGYAALPLIQEQVVTQHGWLSRSEFTDLITISQMTPGPIAVNSATFVGIRLAGFLGTLAATFGCILPSCILVTVLSYLYLKYRKMSMLQGVLETLRPAVVSMIAAAGVSILITAFWNDAVSFMSTKWDSIVIFVIAVWLLKKKNWNPILVMVLSGFAKLAVQGVLALVGIV